MCQGAQIGWGGGVKNSRKKTILQLPLYFPRIYIKFFLVCFYFKFIERNTSALSKINWPLLPSLLTDMNCLIDGLHVSLFT